MPKMIISPQQARHHLIVARKIPLVLLLQKQFHTQEGACSMKNFVIQNRKIFVTTCVAVMLCVVTVLHFAEPQDEQIPKLNLPAVGNIVTANTRVSIADTAESEIDNASQSLAVYRLKPVNINQEKKKSKIYFRCPHLI